MEKSAASGQRLVLATVMAPVPAITPGLFLVATTGPAVNIVMEIFMGMLAAVIPAQPTMELAGAWRPVGGPTLMISDRHFETGDS
jgi:hypothetical protein